MRRHFAQAGFNLIEMIIVLSILGILMAVGVPSFTGYLNNLKVRSTAEALLNGLQVARGAALRTNSNVEFVLTDDDPSGPGFDSVTASTTGRNWLVRRSDLSEFIEGRLGVEGTGRSSGADNPIVLASTDEVITFRPLGTTTLGAAAVVQITNPSAGNCVAAAGPVRCLNVVVSPGGQSRLCDPSVSAAATAAGDTRGC